MEQADPIEQLRELVQYMVSNLLEDMDNVQVSAEQRGSTVEIDLRVPEEDLGKVIGRQGRIAKAMRTLVMIAASRHGLRASLDIDGLAVGSPEADPEADPEVAG